MTPDPNHIVLPKGVKPTNEQRKAAEKAFWDALKQRPIGKFVRANETGNEVWSYHGPTLGWVVTPEYDYKESKQ